MKRIPLSSNQLWSVMWMILNQLIEPKTIPLTEHGQYIPHQSNPLRYQTMNTQLAPQRDPEECYCAYPYYPLKIRTTKQKMHNHAI